MLNTSLFAMAIIYVMWFAILGIVPFLPIYLLAFIFSTKKKVLKQKNVQQLRRLKRALGGFIDKQEGWSAACCCLSEAKGHTDLYVGIKVGADDWNYHTKAVNLAGALDHLDKKLAKWEHGLGSCVSGVCPNYDKCPKRVESSNFIQLININHPPRLAS